MQRRVWSRQQPISSRTARFVLLVVAALAALSIAWFDRLPAQLSGRAQAVDGDTLRIGDQRIRLLGLDALELDQSCVDASGDAWGCGLAARAFLARAIRGQPVVCAPAGRDSYGRILASCVVTGIDLGAQVVASGFAVAELAYLAEEANARASRLGIWSGSFIMPAQWRQAHVDTGSGVWGWIRSWFQ